MIEEIQSEKFGRYRDAIARYGASVLSIERNGTVYQFELKEFTGLREIMVASERMPIAVIPRIYYKYVLI